MTEQTLVLIKPDGVAEGHIGEIISRLERRRFKIEQLKVVKPTKEQLRDHYYQLVDKPFYHEIETYMQSGRIIAMVVSGTNIVSTFHKMAGNTNPSQAEPGTIRGDFGRDWDSGEIKNVVHSSDSIDNAFHEMMIWFPELFITAL